MTKKGLIALAVAAVVAGGTGTAIAAGTGLLGSTKPTDNAWVKALATRLGTTPEKLVEALQGVSTDRIDALVKAGTITQAQADKLKARVTETGGLGFRGMGPGGRGGFGGHGGGMGNQLAAAATFLGSTEADVTTALQGGTTLADLATSKGKTAASLEAALLAAEKTEHASERAALSDAQKTQWETDATARIKQLVEVGPPAGGPRGHGPGMGFGGHGDFSGRGGFGRRGGGLPGLGGGPNVDQLPAAGGTGA